MLLSFQTKAKTQIKLKTVPNTSFLDHINHTTARFEGLYILGVVKFIHSYKQFKSKVIWAGIFTARVSAQEKVQCQQQDSLCIGLTGEDRAGKLSH